MTNERTQERPYLCKIRLADVPVCFCIRFREAYEYFRPYKDGSVRESVPLAVTDEDWEYYREKGITYTGQSEASLLTSYASDFLMDYDALIMHAAAFTFQGRAWLITGESGAGKSTQVRNLQDILPGEFRVICGDRPVLKAADDGRTFVHPSPWNGKEGWHGAEAAELAGIICLERGAENKLETMPLRKAVIPVYNAIIQTAASEETVLKAAALETKILERVEVYRLESHSVPESSIVLFNGFFRERRTS